MSFLISCYLKFIVNIETIEDLCKTLTSLSSYKDGNLLV